MNKYLLYSSIITGSTILLIIYNKYNPKYNILYLCIFLGIITSILNHSSESTTYKYIDRLIMVLNVFVFIYFIMQTKNQLKRYKIAIVFFACIVYLFSKLQKNIVLRNSLHSFSHFLSVILLYILHI
jgi:uncharacterized membrane protein